MRTIALSAVLLLFLAACSSTGTQTGQVAETQIEPNAPEIVDPQEFLEFLQDLNAGLAMGDPRDLNEIEQRRVDRLTAELERLLTNVTDIDSLSENERVIVFNSTQELWATVVGRDEDQIICRREHRVGTNFKRTTCMTVAEMRDRQEMMTDYLRKNWSRPPPLPDGG